MHLSFIKVFFGKYMVTKVEYFTGRINIQKKFLDWMKKCDEGLLAGAPCQESAAVIYSGPGTGESEIY
jgi:hypothetical protein